MKEITVKMAKPSQKDFDCVHDFLRGVDEIVEYGTYTEGDDEPAAVESLGDWVEEQWEQVEGSWSRVLWAGKTAIDNACDPDADVLEFKPEILKAMQAAEEAARLRAGLEMLAQIRAVCGSAQAPFRQNLRIVDAVLLGADMRDLETVEAVAEGRWRPPADRCPKCG